MCIRDRASLELSRSQEVLAIPREAVLEELGVHSVFLLEEEPESELHRLRKSAIRVRPVPFRPTLYEVVSGLRPGQSIATSDIRLLGHGDLVVLAPETPA